MVLFQIRTSASRLSPSPPRARHACRSRPPGRREASTSAPTPRAAAWRRARPRRAKPVDRRASPRLVRDASSVASPRGPAAPARRRVPPPRASRGARSDATWHRARRLSPGGRTGSATRTAGPSTARRCRRRRRRRGSVSPDSSRCAPRLRGGAPRAARLILARARRRRARRGVRDGQPRRRDERLPRRYRERAHETAALVASAASQTVSLAGRRRSPARLRRGGHAAAAEAAALSCGPARRARRAARRRRGAAAAAKRETTHGTRGGAASSASLDEASGDASTRRQAFLSTRGGRRERRRERKTVDSGPARLRANVDFETERTERHVPTSLTERTNHGGKDGKEASPSDLVSRARARGGRRKTKKALKK